MLTKLPQSHALFRFLAVLFFLHACLIIHAQGLQGGDEKVTINGKNIPLRDVFKSITRQTGLHFFYSPEVVNPYEKVTVDVKQQSVDNVLSSLLANKGLAWVYNDNAIAIKEKEQAEKKRTRSSEKDSVTNPVTITLTGKITDAEGNAIPGATVLVKGTEKGTNAEVDGTFTLPGVGLNTVVLISSIGYETRALPVKGKSLNVKLNVSVNDLDETIVIAYGTTTKRLSTGNVSTIKGKEIEKQPVNNPLLALQGRVPGLVVEQSTGLPGSGVTVRIQGQNSLGRGNDPLIIIDGVPYPSQNLPTLSSILGTSGSTSPTPVGAGNPLSFINPSDIESIDILKDADATSIYGARAAAGAILITTKKGKAGPTKVNLNVQSGWGNVTRKLDLLDTQQYLEMRHEAKRNDNAPIKGTDYDINGTWDTTRYTDWQNILIGGTAHYTDIKASVSGGTTKTNFRVGAGYHKETTVFPGNLEDKKGSLQVNINSVSSNQKFHFQLSGSYLLDNNSIITSDLTSTAIKLAPNAPALYKEDGTLNWEPLSNGISTWLNPLASLNQKYKAKTNNLISNILLSYEILPGLMLKTSLGYNRLQTKEITTLPRSAVSPESTWFTGLSSFGNGSINTWQIEPQITFSYSVWKGTVAGLVGTTILETNSERQAFNASGFNSDLVIEDIRAASSVSVVSSLVSKYRYNALFGRLSYNLLNRYILTFNGRRDGSSRFGSENLFHNFGSAAFAWIFSNEKFIQSAFPYLSFAKLRISYGTTGNDQIGDYSFLNLFLNRPNPSNYQGITGLSPNGIPNPYLQWEETKKLNLGLDLGFLKDRILFNASYFNNKSSNQLQSYGLPITTGFVRVDQNFPATINNYGWELSLNTVNLKTKSFTWNTEINLTVPKNKLNEYQDLANSSNADILAVGKPVTIMRLYNYGGVDPITGVYQFFDKDGKLTSDPGNGYENRTVWLDISPKFYGGVQNSFNYKGFELDILFQFFKQIGRNYYFGGRAGQFSGTSSIGNEPVYAINRWTNPGDIASHQKFSAAYPSSLRNAYNQAIQSSAAWTDASYIRLKNIALSWDFASILKNKEHLQNARLYVQGQNLLTITDYLGMDPETKSSTTLPPLRVLTLGMQITF